MFGNNEIQNELLKSQWTKSQKDLVEFNKEFQRDFKEVKFFCKDLFFELSSSMSPRAG